MLFNFIFSYLENSFVMFYSPFIFHSGEGSQRQQRQTTKAPYELALYEQKTCMESRFLLWSVTLDGRAILVVEQW